MYRRKGFELRSMTLALLQIHLSSKNGYAVPGTVQIKREHTIKREDDSLDNINRRYIGQLVQQELSVKEERVSESASATIASRLQPLQSEDVKAEPSDDDGDETLVEVRRPSQVFQPWFMYYSDLPA